MKTVLRRWFVTVTAFSLVCIPLVGCGGQAVKAQGTDCRIGVTVVDDSSGAPLRGIKVVIDSPLTGSRKTRETDAAGHVERVFACEGHPSLEMTVVASDMKVMYFQAIETVECNCMHGEKELVIRLERQVEASEDIVPGPPLGGGTTVIHND